MREHRRSRWKPTEDTVRELAAASELNLPKERVSELLPALNMFLGHVQAMCHMDVGEAQPPAPYKDELWD